MLATAIEYVSEATKFGNSVAALFKALTSVKDAAQRFRTVFGQKKKTSVFDVGVMEFLDAPANTMTDVKNVRGVLVPIQDFKGEEETSYRVVSERIKEKVLSRGYRTPENEFMSVYANEWLMYGCSLQSTVNNRVQLLSLVEAEEINSLPVLVTNRYYKKNLMSDGLIYGIQASVTGLTVPLSNEIVQAMMGQQRANALRLSGHDRVIIPDESLIADLGADFSYKPDIYFNKEKCFFLGFLWVSYMNLHTMDIVPIYEYGNLADPHTFKFLLEKLVCQVAFFKKTIWHDDDRPAATRTYKLMLAYNDDVRSYLLEYFGEEDYFEGREDILLQCQTDLIRTLS